jgi:hypothetical protein
MSNCGNSLLQCSDTHVYAAGSVNSFMMEGLEAGTVA